MPKRSDGHQGTMVLLAAFAMSLGCAHASKVVPPPPSALDAVEVGGSGVPFAPAPEGLLRPGAVESIQDRLHRAGFLASAERSGRLDPPTREALRRFQATHDLPATGLPSYRTAERLELASDQIFFNAHRPPAPTGRKSIDEGSVGSRDGVTKPPEPLR